MRRSGCEGRYQGMEHITICICTYKRPHLLFDLLRKIQAQATDNLFTLSICIVDNDSSESARDIVLTFSESSTLPVKYLCEPQQNIARARNRAIENADGGYIAFIDDDEIPEERWLVGLYKMGRASSVSGVLGPVLPSFQIPPPAWILKGRIFERPSNRTGEALSWTNTRTGNVLLSRRLFDQEGQRFNVDYGRGGEDKEFFRRMIAGGNRFVWCNEAVVKEIIPPDRCKRVFLLRRALLRGKVSIPVPFVNLRSSLKSLLAILAYLPLLAILFFWSHGLFMRQLIKVFDHIGRLLAFFGVDLIKENYIS